MIEKGKKVKIHYTLMIQGKTIDSSREGDPFEYEQGNGQIIPGLENALEGLKPGDKKEVFIGPDDAYGPIVPEAVIEVDRDRIQSDDLQVGTGVSATDPQGVTRHGTVKELRDDIVVIDFNHPLAGKELHFEVEIIEVA